MAIAIATPEHLRALEAWLTGAGVDVAAARACGSRLALDAAATLGRFTSDRRALARAGSGGGTGRPLGAGPAGEGQEIWAEMPR